MTIKLAENRIWNLHRDYCEALRAYRFEMLEQVRPNVVIKHIT